MIDLDHCILLGTLVKTHGVRGQLILRLKHLGFENIKNMESVFILMDKLPVPFFISEYSSRGSQEILLSIDDVDSTEKANQLLDSEVWLHTQSIHEAKGAEVKKESSGLIGYKVVDQKLGELGILTNVLDLKQNPLLQIDGNKKEILIPLQTEFIKEVDDRTKIIYVNTPEGLVDLY